MLLSIVLKLQASKLYPIVHSHYLNLDSILVLDKLCKVNESIKYFCFMLESIDIADLEGIFGNYESICMAIEAD